MVSFFCCCLCQISSALRPRCRHQEGRRPIGAPRHQRATRMAARFVGSGRHGETIVSFLPTFPRWLVRLVAKLIAPKKNVRTALKWLVSRQLCITQLQQFFFLKNQTSKGYLQFYDLNWGGETPYRQRDSDVPGLRRESAELYVKELVPRLVLTLAKVRPLER